MHEIKTFNIWQTSKVLAISKGTVAWIAGVFLALRSIDHSHLLAAIVLITGFPLAVAVLGFIFVALLCWIYNQIAARFGGIAFELIPRNAP